MSKRFMYLMVLLVLTQYLVAEQKVILITGASKGIGKATAEELAKKGHKVYATMRKPEDFKGFKNSSILIKQLDITSQKRIEEVVAEIVEESGRIDVLVNNAGYLLVAPCELISLSQARKQFETNFFGAMAAMQAVLPHMREQKSGHIINISSTSGFDPAVGLDIYAASKYALEGLSASMASYLPQFGINITLIEPGPTKTELLTKGYQEGDRALPANPYQSYQKNLMSIYAHTVREGQDPFEIGDLISRVINLERPNLRYQTNIHGVMRAQKSIVDISGMDNLSVKQEFAAKIFDLVLEAPPQAW